MEVRESKDGERDEAMSHKKVQGGAPDKNKASMEEYVNQCDKAMQKAKGPICRNY